jgi:hypothetical protein
MSGVVLLPNDFILFTFGLESFKSFMGLKSGF